MKNELVAEAFTHQIFLNEKWSNRRIRLTSREASILENGIFSKAEFLKMPSGELVRRFDIVGICEIPKKQNFKIFS